MLISDDITGCLSFVNKQYRFRGQRSHNYENIINGVPLNEELKVQGVVPLNLLWIEKYNREGELESSNVFRLLVHAHPPLGD